MRIKSLGSSVIILVCSGTLGTGSICYKIYPTGYVVNSGVNHIVRFVWNRIISSIIFFSLNRIECSGSEGTRSIYLWGYPAVYVVNDKNWYIRSIILNCFLTGSVFITFTLVFLLASPVNIFLFKKIP